MSFVELCWMWGGTEVGDAGLASLWSSWCGQEPVVITWVACPPRLGFSRTPWCLGRASILLILKPSLGFYDEPYHSYCRL